jgi:ParB family chromosome partitioning protein
MSKKALGKGIGALLKDADEGSAGTSGLTQIPLEKIGPSPVQPRKEFERQGLQELADSIREKGVIQPILVEEADKGRYTIIAGERRYRAAKMAGLRSIPVIVKTLSPQEKVEIALIENIQREDLTPVEEALSYKRLADMGDLSQEEIAQKVGKSRSAVANSLRLLKLPEDMLESLDRGGITAGHARAILSVLNPSDQRVFFRRIVEKGLSVRQAEQLASSLNHGSRAGQTQPTATAERRKDPHLQEVEQRLVEALGTKVKIVGTAAKGKVELFYFSQDDLDRLIEIIE